MRRYNDHPFYIYIVRPSAAQSVNDDTSNASYHALVHTSILSGVNDGAISGGNKKYCQIDTD